MNSLEKLVCICFYRLCLHLVLRCVLVDQITNRWHSPVHTWCFNPSLLSWFLLRGGSMGQCMWAFSNLLTLWLCSDSCHSRCVPGQKWPDSKQLLINLSLCYIITKYWIHSFCQLVFFHLGLVLCFYLHLINRRPHLSESRLLIFWVKKSFFMNNFHNIKQKIIKNCTVSHTSVL